LRPARVLYVYTKTLPGGGKKNKRKGASGHGKKLKVRKGKVIGRGWKTQRQVKKVYLEAEKKVEYYKEWFPGMEKRKIGTFYIIILCMLKLKTIACLLQMGLYHS
jgi:hypothetical protein